MKYAPFAPLLLLATLLVACGEETPPVPDVPPAPPLPPAATAGPETFETSRFFVHLGPDGNVTLAYGRHEQQGELLATGHLMGDAAERSATLASLRAGLERVLAAHEGERPVFMLIAGPGTPWNPIGLLLGIAAEPEIGLRKLDLRLPWDQQAKPLDLAAAGDEAALQIEVLPAAPPARAEVRVGRTGSFLLYDTAVKADAERHMQAINGLRSALQGFASTWKGATRKAHIHVTSPRDAPLSYIRVLAVARVCREKRFTDLVFELSEDAPAK